MELTKPVAFIVGTGGVTHVVLVHDDGDLHVRDMSGRAGIRVNGRPVTRADVRAGDRVQMGGQDYTVRLGTGAGAAASPSPSPSGPLPRGVVDLGAGGAPVDLVGRTTVLGSAGRADIRVTGRGVAPAHAVIVRSRAGFQIWSIGRAVTRVDGRAARVAALSGRTVLSLGERSITFVGGGPGEAQRCAAPEPPGDGRAATSCATLERADPATGTSPTDLVTPAAAEEPGARAAGRPSSPAGDAAPAPDATAPSEIAPESHPGTPSGPDAAANPEGFSDAPSGGSQSPRASPVPPADRFRRWGPLAFAMVASREP
ncbi:MAG TPA: FHA domain-containing protein, partial [Tepidisphaeraceae bacterium]|nr:FHA domain-containing protein [Tepidisphaeraceae bacterium]